MLRFGRGGFIMIGEASATRDLAPCIRLLGFGANQLVVWHMQGTGWPRARLSFRLSIMIAMDLIVGTLRFLPAENDGYSSELHV